MGGLPTSLFLSLVALLSLSNKSRSSTFQDGGEKGGPLCRAVGALTSESDQTGCEAGLCQLLTLGSLLPTGNVISLPEEWDDPTVYLVVSLAQLGERVFVKRSYLLMHGHGEERPAHPRSLQFRWSETGPEGLCS